MKCQCLKCKHVVELTEGNAFRVCPHCGAIQDKVRQSMSTEHDSDRATSVPADATRAKTSTNLGTTQSAARIHVVTKIGYAIVAVCVVLGFVSTLLGLRVATSAPQQLVALCEGLAWAVLPYVGARSLEKLLG